MYGPPRQLLLVEDVLVYVSVLKSMLTAAGILLDTAGNLAEGLNKAGQRGFDAILLDLGLPDSQGLDTLVAFQTRFPELPIIILSGLDDEALAARAVQMGAQDYLIKGPHLIQGEAGKSLLTRSIHYAIERHANQAALRRERDLLETRVRERTAELKQRNEALRSLAARLVSAQEDERRRISLELHDEAGQLLTALKLSLAVIQAELPVDQARLHGQIGEAIALTETTMEELRTLAYHLRPAALDAIGLDQTLRDHCQRLAKQSGIPINYQGASLDDLPGFIQISLYRVIQEALTNILKHAHASQVLVSLQGDAETIFLQISDNGRGFTPPAGFAAPPDGGLGLIGMRERMEAIGGEIEIDSRPGHGTRLSGRIPLLESA
jgi:signal transduction histidine kinase